MGWDFVGRILSAAHARPADGVKWQSTHSIFKKAVYTAKDLGQWILAKSNPLRGIRAVAIFERAEGRIKRSEVEERIESAFVSRAKRGVSNGADIGTPVRRWFLEAWI